MLLVAVAAAAGVPLFYQRFDDEVRRRVEAKIAAHYPELAVSVRAARFLVGKGIEIRGLSIVEPNVSGPTAELIYIEELLLEGNTEWQELLRGELRVSRVVFRRPTIRVAQRPDGAWSAAKLLPLPRLSKDPPRGVIENGVVEILDPLKQQGGALIVRDAQLTFEAATVAAAGPADKAPDGTKRKTKPQPTPLRVQGHFGADHLQRVDIDATLAPSGANWSIAGSLEGLDFSPEFVRALPAVLSRRLAELGSLRCQAQGRFRLAHPGADGGLDFDVTGRVTRGRIDDPRLPYSLTDLRGNFHLDNRDMSLTDVTAHNGQTTLAVDLQRHGYSKQSPCSLVAKSRRMVFDRQLQSILPLDWQSEWHKFLPAGEFDADLKLEYDGHAWRPELLIACKNVSFSYYKFPYRLERAQGRIELIDRLLKLDLKAFTEGEEVRLFGEFAHLGAQPVGKLNVRGDSIRLDEKLFLALNENCRRIVRSLNPRGTFNVSFDLWHGRESPPQLHKKLTLSFNRCSLKYDAFPYPLDNIRGMVVMQDDVWEFKDLEGTNDTGTVECHGRLIPQANGNALTLKFSGKAIALEDELRDALAMQSAAAARFWRDLRPRGLMDIEADLHYLPGQRKPELWVTLSPLYDSESVAVSIEPTYFPYRVEKLRGVFKYHQGRVTLQKVRGEHRTTKLAAEGECLLDGEGGWQLHFERLEVDRLKADRDLVQALNGRLKKAVTDLQPRGTMNLRGELTLASNGQSSSEMTAQWNVQIEGHQVALDCGIALEHIFGEVQLWGSFDGRQFVCNGELGLDSLTYKDFQFTQCLGPIWLDNNVVLCGRSADRQRGAVSGRAVTAKIYGGTVMLDGRVTSGATPKYSVYATLTAADLARCAQEAIAGKQKLSGIVSAEVDLHGTGRGAHHLAGRGSVRLRDADLFELPVMVALLKPLSGRLPDTTAFNTADVDFRIEGEHIYLNKVNCNGDAVSLRGGGEMGFDRTVQLSFYAVVGRGDAPFPILDKVVSAASQQIMQIDVSGTLDNPTTRNRVFPYVEGARRSFQADPAPQSVRAPRDGRLMGRAAPPEKQGYSSSGPK
ncbi:MAG TPA: AsmA-like C-terminal region-containing protein [Pirellulales bacterium]|nr:AsmA-like C-terminal region-containing protein [Pirellulales bacterium]